MSLLAVLGDVHIGARLDSPFYADYLERFISEIFLPYLDKHRIMTVIQIGDLFDRRSIVNLKTLYRAKKMFFDELEKRGIKLYVIVGNHDSFNKENLTINAPDLLLKGYFEIEVIDKPRTLEFDGVEIDLIPWLCQDNEVESFKHMQTSTAKICMGHFQLLGFQMDPGSICKHGLDKKVLSKYDMVLSGHFHHRSSEDNIHYIGNPTQITWIDEGDIRGFSVLETASRKLEFVPSPLQFFRKVLYDDKNDLDGLKSFDASVVTGCYVKVLVVSKTNASFFDKFIKKLSDANPADLKVLDELIVASANPDRDDNIAIEDTVTLMESYVDETVTDVDPSTLKLLFRQLYVKAQTTE